MDVALKANVAKSTAAAALRPGSGGKNARVGKATAERVRRIADQLGYRPNRLASGLRGASTYSVAAVWQFVDSWSLDSNVGNQLLSRFQKNGMASYQAEHPYKAEPLISVLGDLLDRRPDALIIRWRPDLMEHPGVRGILQQFNAVVAVVPWKVEGIEIDQVVHDRDSGIREVVEHFKHSGRRRPAIALNPADITDRHKYQVFHEHCRAMGFEDHQRDLIEIQVKGSTVDERISSYQKAMERHFHEGLDVDAILAVNDVGVMTIAKYMREYPVRVGQDVALVGLNDTPQLTLWDPPLSSINRNQSLLCDTVFDLVMQRLGDARKPPQTRTVPMYMVWRESAGDPPREG